MKCYICEQDFVLKKTWGGNNRRVCYNCIPEGLAQKEREKILYNFFTQKANKIKLERGCDKCSYNKCAQALEWHHPNDDKDADPSTILTSRTIKSFEKYLQEIDKCILLCANCHREEHYGGMV